MSRKGIHEAKPYKKLSDDELLARLSEVNAGLAAMESEAIVVFEAKAPDSPQSDIYAPETDESVIAPAAGNTSTIKNAVSP